LPVSRRAFVATSVVIATGTAGCGDPLQQSFEAPAVGLPDAAHEPLELSETTLSEVTMGFDGPGGSRVELTNHAGVYDRTVGTGDE
jgi:hypothetical protein